jgi:hypothetical protein
MGEMRNKYTIFIGKPEVKTRLRDVSVSGKIILKRILKKYVGGCVRDSTASG